MLIMFQEFLERFKRKEYTTFHTSLLELVGFINKNKERIKKKRFYAEKIGLTGFFEHDMNSSASFIAYACEENLLIPGKKILELGSGAGTNQALFSHANLETYGIELDPRPRAFGELLQRFLRKKKWYEHIVFETILGSYFPQTFIDYIEDGNSEVVTPLTAHLNYGRNEYNLVASEKNPYETLGKSFSDFDYFYGYFWGGELAPVLELFSLYAKKDAVFYHNTSMNYLTWLSWAEKLDLDVEPVHYYGKSLDVKRVASTNQISDCFNLCGDFLTVKITKRA